jgi:hypothetical protein
MDFCNKLECLDIGEPFQPSLMFAGKAGAPVNIRLGWKSLPGTNILAYDKNL